MNEIIKNRKKSEILAERINELNYGDFISHEQIASVIYSSHYFSNYNWKKVVKLPVNTIL